MDAFLSVLVVFGFFGYVVFCIYVDYFLPPSRNYNENTSGHYRERQDPTAQRNKAAVNEIDTIYKFVSVYRLLRK